jgi:hypothetical protein
MGIHDLESGNEQEGPADIQTIIDENSGLVISS